MTIMKMQTDKPLHLLPLMAGIAALLFGTAGVARSMGWLPNSADAFGDILAIEALTAASAKPVFAQVNLTPAQLTGKAPGKRRCAECGVIASMREIEVNGENAGLASPGRVVAGKGKEVRVKSAKNYEFTVRLDDGSNRVITDANPAAWRLGERLNIIDGMTPSNG